SPRAFQQSSRHNPNNFRLRWMSRLPSRSSGRYLREAASGTSSSPSGIAYTTSMKIKERPEDFQVEELTDLHPQDSGPFALYRLEKRNLNTLDALQFVRRRWKIDRQRMSFGGLKDRHAQTIQYFTIFHGPELQLK